MFVDMVDAADELVEVALCGSGVVVVGLFCLWYGVLWWV